MFAIQSPQIVVNEQLVRYDRQLSVKALWIRSKRPDVPNIKKTRLNLALADHLNSLNATIRRNSILARRIPALQGPIYKCSSAALRDLVLGNTVLRIHTRGMQEPEIEIYEEVNLTKTR